MELLIEEINIIPGKDKKTGKNGKKDDYML